MINYSICRSSDGVLAVYEACTCMHILYTYAYIEYTSVYHIYIYMYT